MRTVIDDNGIEWTVFEVKRQSTGARWSYLPEGFESGWLCFESHLGKKRLTPVPSGWRRASDDDIKQMLNRAAAVNRPPFGTDERTTAE